MSTRLALSVSVHSMLENYRTSPTAVAESLPALLLETFGATRVALRQSTLSLTGATRLANGRPLSDPLDLTMPVSESWWQWWSALTPTPSFDLDQTDILHSVEETEDDTDEYWTSELHDLDGERD